MSRSRFAAVVVVAALGAAIAGCCGGAHSHKCDFTPLSSQEDAGSDGPLACGSQVCQLPQVCCLKKIAPFATCIDPADFQADQCEMPTTDATCFGPSDCDQGMVCCLVYSKLKVSCQQPADCQPDGKDVYLTCESDQDCPAQSAGSCQSVGGDPDSGIGLSVCAPQ